MKRITLAALALFVGALIVAGCGGSSGGGSTESSTTTASSSGGSESSEAKGGMVEISEEAKACLKEKGVELPEFKSGEGGPPPGGSGKAAEGGEPPEGFEPPEGAAGGPPRGEGPGGEKFEEQKGAFEECGVEIGGGFAGGPGKPNTNSAAFKKQVKEYVACVRENGYELAEPNFSGEGPVFEKAESESAEFKKASESCQSLLGGPQGSQSG